MDEIYAAMDDPAPPHGKREPIVLQELLQAQVHGPFIAEITINIKKGGWHLKSKMKEFLSSLQRTE